MSTRERLAVPEGLRDGCVMPIAESDVPEFKRWVDWNPFDTSYGEGKIHGGVDLAVYENQKGEYILGLPEGVRVRAVATGVVVAEGPAPELVGEPADSPLAQYYSSVMVDHGGFATLYAHLHPEVQVGSQVEAGAVIGRLVDYRVGTNSGKVTHLHFGCGQYREGELKIEVDPKELLGDLGVRVRPKHAYQGLVLETGEQITLKPRFEGIVP